MPPPCRPIRGTNGYDGYVVVNGGSRDRKTAQQTEGRYWNAPRDPGSGAGGEPGGSIAGYSRKLVKGALVYAGRGVPVFPCEPLGKRPLTYSGFWEATTEEVRIRAWWRRWPAANVAVPTGKSSGLVVLDVDPDEGGEESLAALERANSPHPKTASSRTGGGGTHLFFRYVRRIIRLWIPLSEGKGSEEW